MDNPVKLATSGNTRRKQNKKQKHNTICFGHH